MPRTFVGLLVASLVAAPAIARAQTQDWPKSELSAQISTQTGSNQAITWSPRLTMRVAPLSALELTADFRPMTGDEFGTRVGSQSYGLHLRQTLWSRGRVQVFGVVGAGGERVHYFFPGRTITGRDGPEVIAPAEFSDTGLAVHIGTAVQFEASRFLALRADLRTTLSDEGGLRAMVGGVVPLGGRFKADPAGGNLRAGHDSLTNGIAIGAGTGAVISGLGAGFLVTVLCEQDDCLEAATGAVVVAAVAGAALGGVVGGVVDSLIIRTKPGGASASVAVRWR
jgi:hypothetical protein